MKIKTREQIPSEEIVEKHGMRNIGTEKLEYLCFGTIESEK